MSPPPPPPRTEAKACVISFGSTQAVGGATPEGSAGVVEAALGNQRVVIGEAHSYAVPVPAIAAMMTSIARTQPAGFCAHAEARPGSIRADHTRDRARKTGEGERESTSPRARWDAQGPPSKTQ